MFPEKRGFPNQPSKCQHPEYEDEVIQLSDVITGGKVVDAEIIGEVRNRIDDGVSKPNEPV
jgi:hypothetical protein